jgi:putative addiction module killer protein
MGFGIDHRLSCSTAGIHGLATPYNGIAPHRLLMEREREFVRANTKESFEGIRALTAKAASTIDLVQSIEEALRAGRDFFISSDQGMYRQDEPTFKLRQLMYEIGRNQGFDRLRREAIRSLGGISRVVGRTVSREELLQVVESTCSFEKARVALGEKITLQLEECYQMLAKDKLTLSGVCAFAGVTDDERFLEERRSDTRRAKQKIMEWCHRPEDVGVAFDTKISMDGWLGSMADLGKALARVTVDEVESSTPLGKSISPERKLALGSAVVTILDRIAQVARDEVQLPACPKRDLFKILFALQELDKPLPEALVVFHQEALRDATARLLHQPQANIYLIALEQDPDFEESEKLRIFGHIQRAEAASETQDVSASVDEYEGRVPHESRTAIRREIREAQRAERVGEELRALLSEIDNGRPVESDRRKKGAEILYHPSSLQKDFSLWMEQLQDRVREDINDVLRAAAAGERVDFKPIQLETKVFEVRLLGPGLRIYCTRSKAGDLVVLGFGAKKEQRSDIRTALERYKTYAVIDREES